VIFPSCSLVVVMVCLAPRTQLRLANERRWWWAGRKVCTWGEFSSSDWVFACRCLSRSAGDAERYLRSLPLPPDH
jgi:hypothetical protein